MCPLTPRMTRNLRQPAAQLTKTSSGSSTWRSRWTSISSELPRQWFRLNPRRPKARRRNRRRRSSRLGVRAGTSITEQTMIGARVNFRRAVDPFRPVFVAASTAPRPAHDKSEVARWAGLLQIYERPVEARPSARQIPVGPSGRAPTHLRRTCRSAPWRATNPGSPGESGSYKSLRRYSAFSASRGDIESGSSSSIALRTGSSPAGGSSTARSSCPCGSSAFEICCDSSVFR